MNLEVKRRPRPNPSPLADYFHERYLRQAADIKAAYKKRRKESIVRGKKNKICTNVESALKGMKLNYLQWQGKDAEKIDDNAFASGAPFDVLGADSDFLKVIICSKSQNKVSVPKFGYLVWSAQRAGVAYAAQDSFGFTRLVIRLKNRA